MLKCEVQKMNCTAKGKRFIDRQVFLEKLEKLNFEIVYAEEKNGFSKTKKSDPTLIRIIAKKR